MYKITKIQEELQEIVEDHIQTLLREVGLTSITFRVQVPDVLILDWDWEKDLLYPEYIDNAHQFRNFLEDRIAQVYPETLEYLYGSRHEITINETYNSR